MKFVASATLLLAALAPLGLATPVEPKHRINDIAILNYALTLEHLEYAFYSGALAQFDTAAFFEAGYSLRDRERFVEAMKHEAAYVAVLEGSLGSKATKPCSYEFPYTDVSSFVALSQALEGVGVCGYIGAAAYLGSKNSLAAVTSALSTEVRHSALVSAALGGKMPWGGVLDTALGLTHTFTLAASMISSCPSSNPTVPIKPFPTLCLGSELDGTIAAGLSATVDFVSSDPRSQGQIYVAFFYGLNVEYAEIEDGCVVIPASLAGCDQVYAVVTTVKGRADDRTILAGPAVVSLEGYTGLNLV